MPSVKALERLLSEALAGESRVIVLRGDAGVGKTALLGYLRDRVAGWHVATAVGIEPEMELAYSGLHQLCAPMLDRLDRLPVPQRDALATAFGVLAGPAPDPFLVGLAALTLFSEVSEQQPLICIVDDAQWLDQASAQILGFVARRLLAERIALVCAARTGIGDGVLAGLSALPIGGLGRRRCACSAAGPCARPRGCGRLRPDRRRERRQPARPARAPAHMERREPRRRIRTARPRTGGRQDRSRATRGASSSCPPRPSCIVVAAAAEPLGDVVLLHRAAETLGLDMAAAGPAVDAGLLKVGARLEFAHPLVRSAAYRSAAAEDRQRVHRALAEATDPEADPDRRAWHRARATASADEDVATELERSAGRAHSRGGLAAAAAFLTRAAALTPVPAVRVRRMLDAAFANVQAGGFDTARSLLSAVGEGHIDELQRARIDLLRAQLAFASSRGTEATPLLLAAARRLEPLDISLARETYVDAFSAALFGARLNGSVGVPEVAQAARVAPRGSDDEPATADLLLDALVALADDYDTAVPPCREALQRLSGEKISPKERLRWLWQGCVVALEVWDDESAYLLSHHSVEIARETGTLSELALALSARTPVLVFCGELSAAASAVADTDWVQEATGISSAPYGAMILGAWQGRPRETRKLIEMTHREAGSRGEGIGVAISEYARAVLCNGLGQYEEALVAACSTSEHQEVVGENWGLSELIEPAVRVGRTDLATDALDRLARKARATRTEWALGVEARSRALLSQGDPAEGWFREAIDHLGRTRVRAELARTHLLYGEWLRRNRRRVDAREQLRKAHGMFTDMGMEAFAERARGELQATGDTVRKRTVETRDDLTTQERHIARLARDGLSNPEIGTRLFLSPRTVEWHLHKVFGKLEIRSRHELSSALPSSESELAPA